MEKEMFFDCTWRNIVRYFGRTPDYNNFNVLAEVWDGYGARTVLKSDLPNKIARKVYL